MPAKPQLTTVGIDPSADQNGGTARCHPMSACTTYQGERIPLSSILLAALFTSRATRIASFRSSSEGPGVSALGYSKLLRARRILLNERSARILGPNWAIAASWTAICPPRLVARSPWAWSRLAALLRRASYASW